MPLLLEESSLLIIISTGIEGMKLLEGYLRVFLYGYLGSKELLIASFQQKPVQITFLTENKQNKSDRDSPPSCF